MTKGGKTFAYSYGADGVRTQKTVDGVTTEYYTVGGILLAEKTGDRVLTFYYDEKGSPVSVELNGTRYYYRQNLRGDVIGLYSGTTQVVSYTYDPWGKLLSVTDTSGTNIGTLNPLRYRGYYYDTETGFYFLQSRYYDPTVGRFINADGYVSTGQGISGYNMFAYCGNDPVNRSDSTGKFWGAAIILGVAAAILALTGCSQDTSTTTVSSSKNNSEIILPNRKPPTRHKATPRTPSQQEKSYAATVYAECGGLNKRTKQAVAHVIDNRVGMMSSWTDIEAVISAPGQFNGYNNSMYKAAMDYYNNGVCSNPIARAAMDECLDVVIPIYEGREADFTGGARFFHSFPRAEDWRYHNSFTQVYISGTEGFWFYK